MILGVAKMSSGVQTYAAIVEAILKIVGEQGLPHATVREVATAAGVSIGTVQHHFPTKEVMLASAFTEVVHRVRARLEATDFTNDARRTVSSVLSEILPLDRQRKQEARIQLEFAVHAIHNPDLAETQRTVLAELHQALCNAFDTSADQDPERSRLAAHAAIALADGLALHTVSTERWLSASQLNATVELVLDALLPRELH